MKILGKIQTDGKMITKSITFYCYFSFLMTNLCKQY